VVAYLFVAVPTMADRIIVTDLIAWAETQELLFQFHEYMYIVLIGIYIRFIRY